jgi:hypothetical protein
LREDTRNGYSRKPDDAEDGVPILRISAGTARGDGLVAEEEYKLISGIDSVLSSKYQALPGDLFACRFNGNKAYVGRLTLFTGYLGKQFIYPDKLIRIRLAPEIACPLFLRWISSAVLVRDEIESKCATTVGNWGISAGRLKSCFFPLPPLAEQHRIVVKVDELMAICNEYRVPVIEDAAQSFGARYKGRKSCNLSTIACASFFPSKPLGCYGDGGAIFTNSDELAKVIRQIARHGQDRRYHHIRVGVNSRLDTLQAAILLPKLAVLDHENALRQQLAERYTKHLNQAGIQTTPFVEPHNVSAWAQYTICVKGRDAVQEELKQAGIPTAVHYPIPLNKQPAVANIGAHLPVGDKVASQVVSLPMSAYLSYADQDQVVSALARSQNAIRSE